MSRTIRLQKWLADQGVGSRRGVEKMIELGRVKVNETVIVKQGVKIDPAEDTVLVDNQIVTPQPQLVYFMLNKPVGVVSAARSQAGDPVVTDLVKSPKRVYPVGRLDKDSQGLILLTNDGELTHRLTHPRYHVDKTYIVEVSGLITPKKLFLLESGVSLSDGLTLPAKVTCIGINELEIVIREGRYRQVRRMCQAVGLTVIKLMRVKMGYLALGDLGEGDFRALTGAEVEALRVEVGLD